MVGPVGKAYWWALLSVVEWLLNHGNFFPTAEAIHFWVPYFGSHIWVFHSGWWGYKLFKSSCKPGRLFLLIILGASFALVGTSLAIQWLRLSISNARGWVWFLVRELRSHMPHSQKQKQKPKNMLDHITSLLKTVQYFSVSHNIRQYLYHFLKAC